ncbi:hypothetical protein BsWGS_24954 [Bradybaena similaris]
MCVTHFLQLKIRLPQVVSFFVYAALTQAVLGCITSLLGAVAPEWVITEHGFKAGLLFACNNTCEAFAAEGSMLASKVAVVMAFFFAVAGAVALLIYYVRFFRQHITHKSLPLISALLCFIAVVLDVAGVSFFAAMGKSEAEAALGSPATPGYAFILTIIAGVILACAVISSLLHRCGLVEISGDMELEHRGHQY